MIEHVQTRLVERGGVAMMEAWEEYATQECTYPTWEDHQALLLRAPEGLRDISVREYRQGPASLLVGGGWRTIRRIQRTLRTPTYPGT